MVQTKMLVFSVDEICFLWRQQQQQQQPASERAVASQHQSNPDQTDPSTVRDHIDRPSLGVKGQVRRASMSD